MGACGGAGTEAACARVGNDASAATRANHANRRAAKERGKDTADLLRESDLTPIRQEPPPPGWNALVAGRRARECAGRARAPLAERVRDDRLDVAPEDAIALILQVRLGDRAIHRALLRQHVRRRQPELSALVLAEA